MRSRYHPLILSVAFVAAISVVMTAHRHYRRWYAGKYIEYRGEYILRKAPPKGALSGGTPVFVTERKLLGEEKFPELDVEMKEGLIAEVNSFLSAYSSTDSESYVAFRFQRTTEPWTMETDPARLNRQIPMWPALLGDTNDPSPPLSQFSELIRELRQYREDDGTTVFCVPCVTDWHAGSLAVVSFKTNTIERGLAELHDRASLISKNQGAASKATFLAYPKKMEYPTIIASFVVDTLRSRGKDIIVLQAVWLANDKRWIPVGIGVAPHSGYIAYPF